jgi:hypothetical protein
VSGAPGFAAYLLLFVIGFHAGSRFFWYRRARDGGLQAEVTELPERSKICTIGVDTKTPVTRRAPGTTLDRLRH